MDKPLVSVIVVNYNGAHYLPACLDALHLQTYPAECLEVIVSDNGSQDGSLELLEQEYPWVRVLANGRNLGFASGNNVAIEAAKGEYLILLNNDTAPEPHWVEKMVQVAADDPKAGMVTGRLQLFYDQLELAIESETFTPSGDGRELGIQVYEIETCAPRGVVQFLEGFHGREAAPDGRAYRWTSGRSRLGIPVPLGNGDWDLTFFLGTHRPEAAPVPVRVFLADKLLAEWQVGSGAPQPFTINLSADDRRQAGPVVQNAGSIIFRDGGGRDRGTYVRHFEVFYETDREQYGQVEEVFAGCGASLLLRREMIADIGAFDGDFFMYYEDTDLAWRARLRGWKVLYAPEARVRHIHCGSSGEWSPFFLHHVERNRLAMVFKNGAFRQLVWVWSKYLGRTSLNTVDGLRSLIRRRPGWRDRARWPKHHAGVLWALLRWLPKLIVKRWKIQQSRLAPAEAIENWFVE